MGLFSNVRADGAGNLIADYAGTQPLTEHVADYQRKKTQVINRAFDVFIDKAMSAYAKNERDSFSIQQSEWAAWTANSTAITPYVDTMAVNRGITRDVLMAKIGVQVLFFAAAQGKMKAAIDQIMSATSKAAINAVPMPVF